MVTRPLDFMRGSTRRRRRGPVDVMALLESLQADYEGSGRRSRSKARAQRRIAAGRSLLKRCLGNLVDNAIRLRRPRHDQVEDAAVP